MALRTAGAVRSPPRLSAVGHPTTRQTIAGREITLNSRDYPGSLEGEVLEILLDTARSRAFAVKAHVPPNRELVAALPGDAAARVLHYERLFAPNANTLAAMREPAPRTGPVSAAILEEKRPQNLSQPERDRLSAPEMKLVDAHISKGIVVAIGYAPFPRKPELASGASADVPATRGCPLSRP